MDYQFRMVFSGLSVLVPSLEFNGAVQPAESAVMLLPNLLRPRALSDRSILDSHFPILKFNLDQRQDSSTRQTDAQSGATGLCLLVGEEIEVLPMQRLSTSFSMVTDPPADLEEPTPEHQRSLFWLATMDQAAPGNGRLMSDLVEGPLGTKSKIASRVRLDRGRLVTDRLSRRVCRFNPEGTSRLNRRIAVSLALEIDHVPGPIALSMSRAGKPPERLVLAPRNGEDVVQVEIQNREADEFFAIIPELEPDLVRPEGDFEIFFDLLADQRLERRFIQQIIPEGEFPVDPPHAMCPPTAANQTRPTT